MGSIIKALVQIGNTENLFQEYDKNEYDWYVFDVNDTIWDIIELSDHYDEIIIKNEFKNITVI